MNKIFDMIRLCRAFLSLALNALYDFHRYFCNSATNARRMTDQQLKARIFQKAHSIEKGLAMPTVRPGFGATPLKELRTLLDEYASRGLTTDDICCHSARHAIAAYLEFHDSRGIGIPSELGFVRNLVHSQNDPDLGGFITLSSDEIKQAVSGDFASLTAARHSVRMFAPGIPEIERIENAIRIAGRSPSVCNRQGGRVRLVTDKSLLDRLLVLQGGNRGFSKSIPAVLVVTCYIGLFRGARERNQCWIDGGLFSMSLLYALAYVGLASCPLNWSADYKQDRKLRKMLALPRDEATIMLIAVGNPLDSYRVATSARLPLSQVFIKIY